MTDEEMAEEWVNKNKPVQDDWEDSDIIQAIIDTSEPREKRIAELELKIKHLTEHLEPQTMTALFKQVEEEVRQEQMIEKMKCCGNCSHFKLDNSGLYPINVCELTYPNRCKNHDKWEIKEK